MGLRCLAIGFLIFGDILVYLVCVVGNSLFRTSGVFNCLLVFFSLLVVGCVLGMLRFSLKLLLCDRFFFLTLPHTRIFS